MHIVPKGPKKSSRLGYHRLQELHRYSVDSYERDHGNSWPVRSVGCWQSVQVEVGATTVSFRAISCRAKQLVIADMEPFMADVKAWILFHIT